jgi:hypothetical protein
MKKIASTFLALVLVAGTAVTVNAASIKNGAINFDGGQTNSKVYSNISDAKTGYVGTADDGKYWNVKAIVKVGGNTYSSGFKQGKAYISKKRHWYTNETSGYETQLRDRAYTNWGGNP